MNRRQLAIDDADGLVLPRPERSQRMTARAAVGSRWRRRRDGTVWSVRQTHRKDRAAELERDDALPLPNTVNRITIPYEILRTCYEQLPREPRIVAGGGFRNG